MGRKSWARQIDASRSARSGCTVRATSADSAARRADSAWRWSAQRIAPKRLDRLQFRFGTDLLDAKGGIVGPRVGEIAIVIEIAAREAQHVVALPGHEEALDDFLGQRACAARSGCAWPGSGPSVSLRRRSSAARRACAGPAPPCNPAISPARSSRRTRSRQARGLSAMRSDRSWFVMRPSACRISRILRSMRSSSLLAMRSSIRTVPARRRAAHVACVGNRAPTESACRSSILQHSIPASDRAR